VFIVSSKCRVKRGRAVFLLDDSEKTRVHVNTCLGVFNGFRGLNREACEC